MEFSIYGIAKRLMTMLITIIFFSILIFAIVQLLPGDIAVVFLADSATSEALEALREKWGLNKQIHVQYIEWASGFVRGDLGKAISRGDVEIRPLLLRRFKNSLQIALVSLTFITIFGIGFGIIASLWKGSYLDTMVTVISYLGMSMPQYVTGALLILLFAGPIFTVLPGWGYVELSKGFIPWIKHLILPSFAVSLIVLAHTMRLSRTSILAVLQSDYIRTARLKGLSERTVVFRHILRNALIPTITYLGMTLGWLVGGLVIVEWVFSYPGLGRLIIEAINDRDIPLLKASSLTMASMYFFANFIADLLCTLLNPKERV